MVSSPRPSWSSRRAATEPAGRGRPGLTLLLALLATACGAADGPATPRRPGDCVPADEGYLRARLQGGVEAEIDWSAPAPQCRGSLRPGGDGIRMVFRGTAGADGTSLLLVLGAGPLRAGESTRNVPVNLTLVRVGTGQFYATQGDDRCALDEVRQEPIDPQRGLYRVLARGYCTSPARALTGAGAVLVPRFDLAAVVDFSPPDPGTASEP